MIMYFFMLPRIFTSITRNTRALEAQLLLYNQTNRPTEAPNIQAKIKLFKTLRNSVVVYLISILIINSFKIIVVWYLGWFETLLNEMVVLLMMCSISYQLLPYNRGKYGLIIVTFGALFSGMMVLDGPFPLSMYNVEDMFGEEGIPLPLVGQPPEDLSDIIIVEYPQHPSEDGVLVPLALGVAEKISKPEGEVENVDQ